MAAALLGRDELLDLVRKEYAADLVARLCRRECEYGGDFGDYVLLHPVAAAEHPRTADVHQKHHRQFALLLVDLDVRFARTGGNVPVDIAYVVANAVLAHLGERHAAALERRMIFSCENLVRQSAGLDFDFANPFQNIVLLLLHYGTITLLSISVIISSVEIFSASAS